MLRVDCSFVVDFPIATVQDKNVISSETCKLNEADALDQYDAPAWETGISDKTTPIKAAINIADPEPINSIDACGRILFLKDKRTYSK